MAVSRRVFCHSSRPPISQASYKQAEIKRRGILALAAGCALLPQTFGKGHAESDTATCAYSLHCTSSMLPHSRALSVSSWLQHQVCHNRAGLHLIPQSQMWCSWTLRYAQRGTDQTGHWARLPSAMWTSSGSLAEWSLVNCLLHALSKLLHLYAGWFPSLAHFL